LDSALIIRPEPLNQILSGEKTWEMRSSGARKRGRIGLISKGSGQVIGVADLVDCIGPMTPERIAASSDLHRISPQRLRDPDIAKYRYAWVLRNARRLSRAVPYQHPAGAVIWVSLDDNLRRVIESAVP
jgi:hypothetical protein